MSKTKDRLVKCYGTCEEKHKQSVMQKISGANHCPSCYAVKKKEEADRQKLYQSIIHYFNINFPNGQMLKQIKQFRNEPYNYTYNNIMLTICYCMDVKNLQRSMQYGIAFVPHYHEEMIEYYKNLNEKREQTQAIKMQTVKMKIRPFKFENTYRNQKLINMEDLLK